MRKVIKPSRAKRPMVRTCEACGYGMLNFDGSTCARCAAPLADKQPRKDPTHYEDAHQIAFFDWVAKAKGAHPDLAKVYHVPNGGARNGLEGARLKRMGVRAGQLDLNLDVARGGFFGLRIELKATRAELGRAPQVSPQQRRIIEELREDGYYADVAEGWEAAREITLEYLARPRTVVRVAA